MSQPAAAGADTGTSKMVTTLEAVLIKADGSRVDYGVIASSDQERVPLTPRPEGA